MSVYIKGMEMPTSCFYCPFRRKVDPENIMCIVTRELFEETFAGTIETRNRGNCPLVPAPEHGDLIDRDALEKDIDKYIGGEESRSRFHHWVQVQDAVIPMDKGGGGK